MKRPSSLVLLIALSTVALATRPAAAQLAIQFSSAQTSQANFNSTQGFRFTTLSAATVTGLAYRQPDLGGGAVRLYDAAGNTLVSTVVTTADPTLSTGGITFNVGSIAPFALLANSTYYVAGSVFASAPIGTFAAVGLTSDPRIAYGGGVSVAGYSNPTTDAFGAGANAYFPVDFVLAPTSTTPEPSTVVLLATGLLAVGGAVARRRRARA